MLNVTATSAKVGSNLPSQPDGHGAKIGQEAAMQPVALWLEKPGLGQYAQGFAENDI